MSYQSSFPALKTVIRLLKWAMLSLLVLLLIVAAYLFVPALSDPSSGFLPRKGELQHVAVTRQWSTNKLIYSEITLTSSTGLQAELTVSRPPGNSTPRPMVILMGGYVTGRHAAELIQNTHGIVIAAINYPYHGPDASRGVSFLMNLSKIRQAILDTPPVVLLTLDYLAKQEYVDPTRIELAGVSFGAFLASVPGALDTRFKRVWLIHGSGDPAAIFDYQSTDKIKSRLLRWLVTRGVAILIDVPYLKPERWVGRISPRPVIVVHAQNDPSFPPESLESLHRALRQPYQIIWLGKEHVGVHAQVVIQQIADLLYKYMSQERPTQDQAPH